MRVLGSDGSPKAISQLLQHLVLLFNANRACFFNLHPFDGYQEWVPAQAGAGQGDATPSRTLLDAIKLIDWGTVTSGDSAIQSQNSAGLLLIPVVHRNHCVACLGVEAATVDEAWPRATVDLLATTALMLGEVLEHRKTDHSLSDVCERLDLTGQLSNIGMWDWNTLTGELYWSDTHASLFGLPADTNPSYERFMDSVHPEDRDDVEEAIRLCIDEDIPYCHEHRIVRPDGKTCWMLGTGGVLRHDNGKVHRMVGVVQDITARKMTEQALQGSQQLLRQFGESIKDVVFIRDIHPARFVFINAAYESLWGDSISELYKDPLRFVKFIHPDDLPDVRKNMARLEQGIAIRHEYRLVRQDHSERWVRVDAFPVRDEEGKVFRIAGLAEDITDQRNKEAQRKISEYRQRNALVREVHHRIKNNLQGILGLLRQELGEHPALESTMENAISKVRSIAIIHGLQSQGAHGEIYLCEIVEAIVLAVRDIQGKSINLKLKVSVDPPLKILPEEAVPVALILNELLTNAIKHAGHSEKDSGTHVEFITQQDRGVIKICNSAPSAVNDFDMEGGKGLGTGLELIRSLLPHAGANLDIRYVEAANQVEARFALTAPIIVAADRNDRLPVFGKMKMTV